MTPYRDSSFSSQPSSDSDSGMRLLISLVFGDASFDSSADTVPTAPK